MPEAKQKPPTADELNDAIATILKIDQRCDLPSLVMDGDATQFADALEIGHSLRVLRSHLLAEGVSAPPPPPMFIDPMVTGQ